MEFVYLASQRSMAALLSGFAFHSFCNVPFMRTDGVMVNARGQRRDEHGVSNLFLRFERLRWIFIDFPTMGCEVLAIGDDNVRTNTRDENTWALRNLDDKRPWGGMNLGFTGDT